MRFPAVFAVFVFIGLSGASFAQERTELIDEDGDGRKETTMFYDQYGKVKAEVDRNGDGKPDRFVKFKGGVKSSAENDKNFDGTIDSWDTYSPKGSLIRTSRDSNGDGKPDQFKQMLKGRTLILKESDRNFDGRIDRRQVDQWGTRKFGPGVPSVPGYITLWREEDNDFDGKIDVYREKGKKGPFPKIGQPMDTQPSAESQKATVNTSDERPGERPKAGTPEEERMKRLNERYGLA